MSEEKRKYIRFECLVPVEVVEIEEPRAEAGSAVIENVSREGIRVVLDMEAKLKPGSGLQFKIHNPEEGRSCSLNGEVIWAQSRSGKLEVGLKIKDVDECAKAELLEIGYEQWRRERKQQAAEAAK
jgi:hypothetical protein